MQYSSTELDLITYQRSANFLDHLARGRNPLHLKTSMACDITYSESERELNEYFQMRVAPPVRLQEKKEVQYPIKKIYTSLPAVELNDDVL